MYDAGSPEFRRYLTPAEWNARHAPFESDVGVVTAWLKERGFDIYGVASNRLLVYFRGNVGQFNDAFGVKVRIMDRKSPQIGNPAHEVFGLTEEINPPPEIKQRVLSLVALDLDIPEEGVGPDATPTVGLPTPMKDGYRPEQIARGYNIDKLYQQGFRGRGQKLGIMVAGDYQHKAANYFWKIWGITRSDPHDIELIGRPQVRIREAQLDVEWAAALAPEAEVFVYHAPDARNTSMVYAFNEAIARGEVGVLTTSFAHREDSEPRAVRWQYHYSAMMAAALGITVCAASGDSAGVDVPSNSTWVTGVGGTEIGMIDMQFVWERSWSWSGGGTSLTIPAPLWQQGLPGVSDKRATPDVALNAGMGYWYLWLNRWYSNTGTSFASPVFAALLTVVNDARAAQGKPRVGFVNRHLYTRPEVQASFRDITTGWEEPFVVHHPRKGWDMVTGWGAPQADGLLQTLP
jgi:kumamolisin